MWTKSYMDDDGSFEKVLSEISLCVSFLLFNLEIPFDISSGF